MKESESLNCFHDIFKNQFNQLTQGALQDLIDCGDLIQINPGIEIIKQGEHTKDVYFLIKGRIAVDIVNDYGEKINLNEIPKGELFGEMSYFNNEPRAATLTTTKESTILKLSTNDFEILQNRHSCLLKYINRILINRLRKANLSNRKILFQNICFVQLVEDDSSTFLLNTLKEKVNKEEQIFFVSKELAIQKNLFKEGDSRFSNKDRFDNWVHEIENQHDYIIYLCDQADLEWSELCICQADRIMLLGSKKLDSTHTNLEEIIFNKKGIASKIEKNLIFNWNESNEISNVSKLIGEREIKNIFHVADDKDVLRIIRYITGKSIKLVLGGGGAKGFAHLGVYKAMLDLGIPVDFVGGTSVGSIIGAAIGTGWSYDVMVENARNALVTNNPLNDYHLPLVSLIKGDKMERTLKKHYGGLQIEDLKVPFYAVASNFTESKIEILNQGSLDFAVRASISLPSILPPAVKDNSLLVDGGLIDNLPFDHMNSLAQGPIIGVDLSSKKVRKLGYDKIPSNGKILKQKVLRKKTYKVPSLSQIMMGTMTLASEEKRRNNVKKFDIYIKPDVAKYGFLKWKNFDEILKCGYDAAYPILKEWKENNEI